MDADADRRLKAALAPGEEVLWTGKPKGGILFRSQDLLLVPFSLLWCGFAVFWEVMAFRKGEIPFFWLFGIPFVLLGLHLVFGRFPADALRGGRTRYAVTGSRVLLVSGLFAPTVQSLPLRNLPLITLKEHPDGTGDIALGAASPFGAFAIPGWPGMGSHLPPTLERIPAARRVHQLLLQAQGAAG